MDFTIELVDLLNDYIEEIESQIDIDPDDGSIESQPYLAAGAVVARLKRMRDEASDV